MDYKDVSESEIPTDARRGGGRPWHDCAEAVRAREGEWLEVKDHDMTPSAVQVCASRIRLAKLRAFEPKGAYEAKSSGARLFVRYVGDLEMTS